MARKLDRRTVLRGMLGAAAVSVALPALEIFLNDNGDAYAGQSGFPTRFGWWFWGNGVHPEKWVPSETGTGTEWSLPPQLVAMEDVKDDITLITGMKEILPKGAFFARFSHVLHAFGDPVLV